MFWLIFLIWMYFYYSSYFIFTQNYIDYVKFKLIGLCDATPKGYQEGDGKFTVEDVLFYESGPQATLQPLDESPLVVLISGLDQVTNRALCL